MAWSHPDLPRHTMVHDPPPLLDGLLVLGAGWLGAPLAASFAAAGTRVTTVRRTAHEAPPGGTALAFDLATLGAAEADAPLDEATRRAFAGHHVVVALVAPDRSRGDDHARTYPVVARAAVRIAHAIGARALCWISSTGVYGRTDGGEVTEETPRTADTPSQRALCEAEDTVLAGAGPALRVGVLRASGLYGPGRDPAPRYRDPSALAGRADQWVNLAWRDDVIAAIRCWIDRARGDAEPPRVLNVSDGTPLTVAECARLVARADGRAFAMPEPATVPVAPGAGALASRGAAPRSNQRIRVDELRALGWAPSVPTLREGLLRLGYTRLGDGPQPYGPQTAEIRAFLRALAGLDAAAREAAALAWHTTTATTAYARADRALGEALVRAGREAERDAAAGPLLQLVRVPVDPARAPAGEPSAPPLDPITEPALAALMALVVRDLLPVETFDTLVAPLASLVPPRPAPLS